MSSQRELEREAARAARLAAGAARLAAAAAVAANEAFRAGDVEELAVLLGVNEENAVRLVRLLEQEEREGQRREAS